MSASAAMRGYNQRRKNLEEFLRSRQSGVYSEDFAIWADSVNLCTRTAKEYWHRAEDRELIEINGNSWKWIAGEHAESGTEYMQRKNKEKEDLRQKLREKLPARLMTNE